MDEITINEADLPWEGAEGYHEGTQWKVLCRASRGQPRAALVKLPPSFEMEAHAHVYVEHHYVLQGQYESRGERYPVGSYRMIPRHTDHGPFQSEKGALVLVVWEE